MTLTPEARRLLDAIAGSESAGRYDVMYGGGRFDPALGHPRTAVPITTGPNKGRTSSAAGRYQMLGSTWDGVAAAHGLKDFSPENQDLGAWYLADEEYRRDTGRDLQGDLAAGRTADVARSLRDVWTSLPGGIEQGQSGERFTGDIMPQSISALYGAPSTPPPAPTMPPGAGRPAAPSPAMPAMPPSGGAAMAFDPGGRLGSLASMFLQTQMQNGQAQQQAQAADAEARRALLLGAPLIA